MADGINQWRSCTPETQHGALQLISDSGALKAELWNSTWGWKTINSPLIPIIPETSYQFNFRVAGENAHGVHVKILEYDQNKTYLTAKIMENVGSGNFTWKDIQFQYTPSPNASYIQLQIWHGHETTQPLLNRIWIDHVNVYSLKDYQPSDLDIVCIYSTQKENEILEGIFTPKEIPAEVTDYQKIDPTKYVDREYALRKIGLRSNS